MPQQVDFTSDNFVEPDDEPAPFPPADFTPGSVGDEYYSPLVVIDDIGGSVWNAPIIASGVDTEFLNQFCGMDAIPANMTEEAYKYVPHRMVGNCCWPFSCTRLWCSERLSVG